MSVCFVHSLPPVWILALGLYKCLIQHSNDDFVSHLDYTNFYKAANSKLTFRFLQQTTRTFDRVCVTKIFNFVFAFSTLFSMFLVSCSCNPFISWEYKNRKSRHNWVHLTENLDTHLLNTAQTAQTLEILISHTNTLLLTEIKYTYTTNNSFQFQWTNFLTSINSIDDSSMNEQN